MITTFLNEKTEETVKRIHLLVTTLCERNCKNCCNHLYTIDEVPRVTDDELKHCETLFLTGGEPFQFTNPNQIAKYYKEKYPNIQKVIVYSNVKEFSDYIERSLPVQVSTATNYIDGVSLSIKSNDDVLAFDNITNHGMSIMWDFLKYNRLYVFEKFNLYQFKDPHFEVFPRKWQPLNEYRPAKDSIFRMM